MPDPGFNAALRRKIQRSDAPPRGKVLRPEGVGLALSRALRKAATPFDGLLLDPKAADPVWDLDLKEGLAALPAHRMTVVLEDGRGARGLCVLENTVVDALVEVQTTGKVDQPNGLIRPATQIDAVLTRDFIGLFLTAFEGELASAVGVNWPRGLTYGTHITDPKQLDLLLPNCPHHLFRVGLELGGGLKSGDIVVLVPATGPVLIEESGSDASNRSFGPAWTETINAARVCLEGIVLRRKVTLAELEAMAVGDILKLDRSDLAGLPFLDVNGHEVLRARLGKQGSKRAIALNASARLAAVPAETADNPGPVETGTDGPGVALAREVAAASAAEE